MKCTIKISMDGAAFDDGQMELARILKELAVKVSNDRLEKPNPTTASLILDINGNTVGEFKISGKRG